LRASFGRYDGRVTEKVSPNPKDRPVTHRSGKLVVIGIFAFGLMLGMIGFKYRRSMPKPTTRPSATQRTVWADPAARKNPAAPLRYGAA
jgi:hypothetical protein